MIGINLWKKTAWVVAAALAALVFHPVVAAAQTDECVAANAVSLTPVSREPAYYPEDAFLQGIEGYVVVTYDVARDGSVENLRLAESEPRGVFEHGVIQAVLDWRYEPPTDRFGNSVRVCGKRQRFSYTLDQ